MMAEVTAAQVKELRDRTGAPMLACRNALRESEGDIDTAIEQLRARGEAQAAKRAGNEASEGVVDSYIHAGGQIGVLVEVNCETDFVARNDDFRSFVHDLALHIAAAAPLGVSDEDIPAEDREREERIAVEQAADRPENVRERIVSGEPLERGQVRRPDHRGSPCQARLRHGREHRHPPVRALCHRRLSSPRTRKPRSAVS